MARAHVRVVRIWRRDNDLQVDVVKGVGFRAEQAGEWAGPTRKTFAQAMVDARQHNQQEANQ